MDILRENIGLLQLDNEYYYDEEPINEFSLFGKKKTRWQRFKDAIKNNKGKIAAGALGLGAAAWTGHSRYGYNKMKNEAHRQLKAKGYVYNKDKDEWVGQINKGKIDIQKIPSDFSSSNRMRMIDKYEKRGYTYNKDKDELSRPQPALYQGIKIHGWNPLKQYKIPTKDGKIVPII